MATRTIITCDKCGKEWLYGSNDFHPVTISVDFNFGSTTASAFPSGSNRKQATWCRECVMSSGVYAPITKEDKELAPVELTFEQKVIMLIEELGFIQGQ